MMLQSGLFDRVITSLLEKQIKLLGAQGQWVVQTPIDPAEGHSHLAQYLGKVVADGLSHITGADRVDQQVAICNELIVLLNQRVGGVLDDASISPEAKRLLAILDRRNGVPPRGVERPDTPLAMGCLLTGTRLDPSLVTQLRKEILTSNRIDILCSFIKWSGIRILKDHLERFVKQPGAQLRIITTSYMGATDIKALDFLLGLKNTELKISYDTHRTRLHAKAYMFSRNTDFGCAYIGSANISHAALTDGLEWNVKISQYEQPHQWEKVCGTFETYWNDGEFQRYDESQREKMQAALNAERTGGPSSEQAVYFDLKPYTYQQEILDRIQVERELQGHKRHLVVAATGTGKTMVAAFDFRTWLKSQEQDDRPPRFLFVAHREEILKQSLQTFRGVLRDQNFGDLMVGGHRPQQYDQLFVSIQTVNSQEFADRFSTDHYDYVVIDEFHHAAAESYQYLLSHIEPRCLLGLTATPERADGLDILEYFDGHVSAEIRLPDAINRKLLSPFQYFCVTDNVNLSSLAWQRGGYRTSDLENVFTGNSLRDQLVVSKIKSIVCDVSQTRGLAFCVSVKHAEHMARCLTEAGIPATCLTSESPDTVRRTAQDKLLKREVNFICVVDLYNEGVDIPEVDTVVFLRPTESLTVYLQQLGRGLRLSEDKDCLTVIDFVGQPHQNYRFDLRFRALLTDRSRKINQEAEDDFPHLPAGCTIQMERIARQYILENIKQNLRLAAPQIVKRIRSFTADTNRPLSLPHFIDYYDLEMDDIYRRSSWARLCFRAGQREDFAAPDEGMLQKGLRRIEHIDDPYYIRSLLNIVQRKCSLSELSEVDRCRLLMLHFTLWPQGKAPDTLDQTLDMLDDNPVLRDELCDVLALQAENIHSVPPVSMFPYPWPLSIHCSYTRDELLAALGYWTLQRQPSMREGVLHLPDQKTDVFLTTLNKAEHEYSPTTMYEDYAISETLFHWQSQSTTSETSPTGLRYIEHAQRGHNILLFVRENRATNALACPYYFLGPARYISHHGSRPMSITWQLLHAIPAHLLRKTNRMAVS